MSPIVIPAYIDPNIGYILWQVIAAGVIGSIGYFHRAIWRVCRMLVGKRPSEPPKSDIPKSEPPA